MELFFEYWHHNRVIKRVKTLFYVALDEPFGACPSMPDRAECAVTSPLRPKPVRMTAHLRFVVGFKDEAYYFLQEFICPCWDTKRAQFSIFLWNMRSPHWCPLKPFITKIINELFNFLLGHAIHGFVCCPFGHRPIIGVKAGVRSQVQHRIVELSINVFQRQSSFATFSDDS